MRSGLVKKHITDKNGRHTSVWVRTGVAAKKGETLYHGSRSIFEKFSLDFMSKGEGDQAFGWGLYFTSLKAVAHTYSRMFGGTVVDNANIEDWAEYSVWEREEEDNPDHFITNWKAREEAIKRVNEGSRKFKNKEDLIAEIDRYIIETEAYVEKHKKIGNDADAKGIWLVQQGREDEQDAQIDITMKHFEKASYARSLIATYKNYKEKLKDATYKNNDRVDYKVELAKDLNMFPWEEKTNDDIFSAVEKQLEAEGLIDTWRNVVLEREKHHQNFVSEDENGELDEDDHKLWKEYLHRKGKRLYHLLQRVAEAKSIKRRKKWSSELLQRAGFDGIVYPTGSLIGTHHEEKGHNYVVFDPDNIRIIAKESY